MSLCPGFTPLPCDGASLTLHLTKTGANPPTMNATVTALRFFFKVTLDRPETTRRLAFVHEPRRLPRVLSPEDVLRLLEAAPNPKYKAALSVAYGAGLRATARYAQVATNIIREAMSPLDRLTPLRPKDIGPK